MIDPTTLATLVVADYLGDTADDGKYEGHGSAVFKSGHSYEGEFLRGFMHGEGTFSWRDGVRFQGDFVRNKISGRGEYVWKNGCTYVGEVEDGLRHGMGEFSCAFNGAVYTGEWKEGKQHGRGIILYANGSKYEGQWTEGLKEGHGVMYYPNGNVYDGEWLKNVKHGVGRMDWNDCGETYQGEWMHGLPHGKGTYIWTRQMSKLDQFPLENRYEGDWENGKRSGKGTFYYASGAAYSGEWKDNLKHGAGHFISENGRSYIGFFKNDRPVDEWPKHQNGRNTFLLFALAQLVEEAGFDEDVKLLNSAVLRHISLLRDLYTGYCKVGRSNSGGANSIARVQLWKFLIDCKLAKKGVHLGKPDRKRIIWRNKVRSRNRPGASNQNPHDETAQFIFFEFVEAVLRISHIVYRNQQNLSLHERGLVACFSAFLTHDVIPNRQPEPQDFESSGDPSAMVGFLVKLFDDFEGLFSKKVFDVYTLLARSRKTSLPESKNDKTITIRELLFHLSVRSRFVDLLANINGRISA
ncbi:hypothetical protein DFJ73DRAFT_619744 [Zopfochytrium polystomum]|nr:hypothetical protein DFJ73DRAFT_619744 [Zopfochytrium polystomum]